MRESYRNLSVDEKITKRNIANIKSKYMSDVDRERRKEYMKYVCHEITFVKFYLIKLFDTLENVCTERYFF